MIGISFLIIPLGIFLHGLVLSVLWNWFMVHSLHLPSLNLMQATGIMIVLSFVNSESAITRTWLKYKLGTLDEKGENAVLFETACMDLVVHPLLMLAIGYLVYLFI